MAWFWNRSKKGVWKLGARALPWGDGPSIYVHICRHLLPDGKGLRDGGDQLPDEDPDVKLRLAPGTMDGIFTAAAEDEAETVTRLHRAITRELEYSTDASLRQLYDELRDASALHYADPLLDALANDRRIDRGRLHALAIWLTKAAPHRNPVKLALVILGLQPDEADRTLLLTLGLHDELSLYAGASLVKLHDGERNLVELAQQLDGWGKIQVVRRLANTTDPQIKAWMLRQGYKSSIMDEYLAYTCAVAGGLQAELSKDSIDRDLLDATGDLLQALLARGPAEHIDDYDDGAQVAELYLRHLGPSPRKLQELVTADALLRFLDEEGDWSARAAKGWTTELRAKLREQCMRVKSLDHWPALIRERVQAEDPVVFREASYAARMLGVDAWNEHFTRLQAGQNEGWHYLMQADDPERIDRVVALAEERLPLREIAAGPGEELGLSRELVQHRNLSYVLQELRRFPGKGWPLLRAGVRSPLIHNRYMALQAFSTWGKARWPSDASELLTTALREEPLDNVRAALETVLAGNTLEASTAESGRS